MRTPALLTFLGVTAPLLALQDDGVKPRSDASSPPAAVQGLGSGPVARQAPLAPSATSSSAPILYPGGNLYRLSLPLPAGGSESFSLFVPVPAPAAEAPLLVHFHAANGSGLEVPAFTSFVDEASARGWYLVAPDQAVPGTNGLTYSMLEAQARVEAVLDWVLTHHRVDRERLYAYGFSMGGGDVLSYAARHLDPARGAFAAIVTHTGTACLPDEYERCLDPTTVQNAMVANFAGPPVAQPFRYLRSSALELDPNTFAWNPLGAHLAQNLVHVPLWGWYGANDPHVHLVQQLDELDDLLQFHGATNPMVERVRNKGHVWEVLDEWRVCDWFASKRLTVPDAGELRVDSDGVYHHYAVTVDDPTTFATLRFDATGTDTFILDATRNVERVEVDVPATDLDTLATPFFVRMATADSRADVLALRGFGRTPGTVRLNGAATVDPTRWTYDPAQDLLTLLAPSAGAHDWAID